MKRARQAMRVEMTKANHAKLYLKRKLEALMLQLEPWPSEHLSTSWAEAVLAGILSMRVRAVLGMIDMESRKARSKMIRSSNGHYQKKA